MTVSDLLLDARCINHHGERLLLKLDIPVVGILRGIDSDFFPHLLQAAFRAGLQAIEVTMNTPGACDMIRNNLHLVPEGCYLGIGTVRNLEEARQAVTAGAMFLVTPNTDVEVIEYARRHNTPIAAGAYTPTEVYRAWSAGADMVKVFPCPGPKYIRDLLGPMDEVSLVAVGGVRRDNLRDFLDAGAVAVGVGNSLFGAGLLQSQDADGVCQHMSEYLEGLAT
ncbi:MAG: bifunctional 4-hydroxy-2-oxoglutarate aldolase/2-dehydro-3-deoxy-phosphogluconate aldolase [Gammaproteobacteria bacterium]|nr:bifunctional 4-hydroxy-2-oxoglutarate aldolase/2-dehydro-3-deoxy-phosphogluconate aldolase [Gammaproteobacteria bacterium]